MSSNRRHLATWEIVKISALIIKSIYTIAYLVYALSSYNVIIIAVRILYIWLESLHIVINMHGL